MGKIKNWNKISSDTWRHKYGLKVTIGNYDDIGIKRQAVYVGYFPIKTFKTKKEALDYAIKYMRSHPNG